MRSQSVEPRLPVEVVVACHSPERRLNRAVTSVLAGNGAYASVTVVAHNVSRGILEATLDPGVREHVRWLQLRDATRSPANPYNLGTARADAKWVSLLGSDDYLQPGAVEAWLDRGRGADAVIARSQHDDGRPVRTPPIRVLPHRRRSAVKDRLFYRSAPLGLMRKSFLEKTGLHWDADLPSGGDLRLSTALWSRGRVAVQTRGPAYVVGSDAGDRVTMALAPLDIELQHVALAWADGGWAWALTHAQRTALGTKYIRILFFGAAYNRALAGRWGPTDRQVLASALRVVLRGAPEADRPLSIADKRLLDALLDVSVSTAEVNRLAFARRRFGSPAALLPAHMSQFFNREAPPRFMIASALRT